MTRMEAKETLARLLDRATKALSVRTPWAWMIVAGHKNVENRSWTSAYRGPLIIHAGYKTEPEGFETAARRGITLPAEPPRGGIIGVVDLVDVRESSTSVWYAAGHYAWILKNPRPLPFTPCRGRPGLFVPDV